jgi:hypothetical protein
MTSSYPCTLERLDNNIVLTQLDDLCLVHVGKEPVDSAKTREVGERLKSYLEHTFCRKLVISFDGTQNIYGFVLDRADEPLFSRDTPRRRGEPQYATSEMWLG